MRIFRFLVGLASFGFGTVVSAGTALERPPEPPREFRGVWISTIHNVDWPSRENLPAPQQQAELLSFFDRCADLGLNAVVLQVRSECDALYPSELEPWCPWLTGTMGESPGYDPLQFAIDAAHARGLELHAWFNPFRAVNSKHVTVSPSHISRTHPEYTTKYGDKIWLDPAQPFVRERALAVIRDVIRRYDIDAVHLDDYFYPYPAKSGGTYQDFDDAKSWAAYQKSGGALPRPDWRRDQVNQFVRAVHALVRQEKSSCKFGISPFGIYRPGQPAQVKDSLDCYDQIFADTRLWLREGWLDYLAPQLYWESTSPQYGFAGLYQWWQTENVQHRHVWPGIALYRIKSEGRTAYDPLKQVAICRGGEDPIPDAGHLLFSMSTLVANDSNIDGLLKTKVYTKPALVPESPWLGEDASLLPQVSPVAAAPATDSKSLQITWPAPADSSKVRWWLVQSRSGTTWQTLRPIASTSCRALVPGQPEQVAIRAIGRSGVLGPVQTISTAPVSEPVSVP